ncbi:MAG TPA: O-antigen polymerase [Actinomycetota bacterium]
MATSTMRRDPAAPARRTGPSLALALAAAAGAAWIVVTLSAHGFTSSRTDLIGWIGALGVVSLGPIALLRRGGTVWSSLGAIYAVEWFASFGLASLVWLGSPEVVWDLVGREEVTRSIALMTLGIGCFWAGYLWLLSRPKPAAAGAPRVWCRIRWDVVGFAYVAGIASRLYLMHAGVYGFVPGGVTDYTMVLQLAGVAAEAAVYGAFASVLDDRTRNGRLAVAAMVAGLVVVGLASGEKWEAIRPLLALGLIYTSYQRRVPKLFLAGTAAVLVLIILPGSQLFRSRANQAVLPASQLVGTVQIQAIGQGLQLDWERRLQIAGLWLQSRPRSIDQIALIESQTPEPNPYEHGRLWALAPVYNLIPRILWPSKPVLSLEYDFDRTYRHLPATVHTNSGLTQPGDMYINFGLAGVVFGMFGWGLSQAWLMRRFGNAARPDQLMVLVMAASFILLFQRSVTDILLALPRILAVTWLLGRLMYERIPLPDRSRGAGSIPGPGGSRRSPPAGRG